MKIVHAADLHIDSPLKGLTRYEGAPVDKVRRATRDAFARVVDVCLREAARFLVLAGDVFDTGHKDARSGLFFVTQLQRLREIGCDVLLLRGNHDYDLTGRLDYPEHVHEFAAPGDDGKRPAGRRSEQRRSFVFEKAGVAFHGVSYASQAVKDTLLPHYPAPVADLFNVGVLHTNATGDASLHAAYAPCKVNELVARGYGYWALGHVHGRATLSDAPFVGYPGNTQGRSVRETGAKGCLVLEIDDRGKMVGAPRFEATDVMRWEIADVVLAKDDGKDDVFGKVRAKLAELADAADGRLVAARVRVTGACTGHGAIASAIDAVRDQIRADALDLGGRVWVEKVELATRQHGDGGPRTAEAGLVHDLFAYAEELRSDDGESDRTILVGKIVEPLRKHRALSAALAEAGVDLSNPALIERALERAEALLAERLGGVDRGDD